MHRRADTPAPDGGLTADERARAAGTSDPGVAGDTHVAGPPRPSPAKPRDAAPRTAPNPAPGPMPPAGRAEDGALRPERAAGPRDLPERLLDPAEAERLRARFRDLQSAFVDDPGTTVRDADALVAEAAEALARALAARRSALAEGHGTGADTGAGGPDTERLRQTLRAYRDLLDRVAGA